MSVQTMRSSARFSLPAALLSSALFSSALLSTAVLLSACSGEAPRAPADAAAVRAGPPDLRESGTTPSLVERRYICPMHPHIVREQPGSCPICGMQLVPRTQDDAMAAETAAGVSLDPGLRQSLGIRVATAELRVLRASVQVPAQVVVDEHRISHLHTRVAGWVETLRVHAIGEPVEADAVLMEIYAPDLVAAQEDYLIALRAGGPGSRAQRAAGVRLRQLGMDDGFIEDLAKRGSSLLRVPIRAPRSGVLSQLNVRHGMYVEPSTVMLEIADLSRVWIRADVFPEQLDLVGQHKLVGEFRLPGVRDRTWHGALDYVYPSIDAITQTVHLRFAVDNPDGLLRPGSYMDASLRGEDPEPQLAVPSEALIRTADGDRVVLDEGDGRFRPQAVHAGQSADGWTSILHGLSEGQWVVVSGQFLLDSESALRAGLQRLGDEHAH